MLKSKQGSDFIEHFFQLLYDLTPKFPQSNIIGYALKTFSKEISGNSDQSLTIQYLQRLLYATPHLARFILPLLIGFSFGKRLTKEFKTLLDWGVRTCVRRNDVLNLLWFLYTAIALKLKLSKQKCDECLQLANPLVDVVLVHGHSLGLFRFSLSDLTKRLAQSDFTSDAWMPLYEIERRGWDQNLTMLGTSSDTKNLYGFLAQANVSFYDASALSLADINGWKLKEEDFNGSYDMIHGDEKSDYHNWLDNSDNLEEYGF